jgi:hypothetical protein
MTSRVCLRGLVIEILSQSSHREGKKQYLRLEVILEWEATPAIVYYLG